MFFLFRWIQEPVAEYQHCFSKGVNNIKKKLCLQIDNWFKCGFLIFNKINVELNLKCLKDFSFRKQNFFFYLKCNLWIISDI